MTVIIGMKDEDNKRIIIGGDTALTCNSILTKSSKPKVFKKWDEVNEHEYIFGVSGVPRCTDILQYKLNIPKRESSSAEEYMHIDFIDAIIDCMKGNLFSTNDNGRENTDCHIMIGTDFGSLYVLEGNFQLIECITPYYSIGSGQSFALGSLYASQEFQVHSAYECVEIALNASAEFCTTVDGPFDIETLDYRERK